ncbi:MAG: tetratricopeptide repeat protein [Candidatus Omnitrophica bacterium]|nr:tetratricopeptide repeat protein [Candidatus Omnitrophota bacterium]
MNNKLLLPAMTAAAALIAVVAFIFWGAEARKNSILKNENVKTIQEVQKELEINRAELKELAEAHLKEKNKLLSEMQLLSLERDSAVSDVEMLKEKASSEADICKSSTQDVDTLSKELARVRKERSGIAAKLEAGFKRQKTNYETRILSLESQLTKAKSRLSREAEKYHYNLGAVYTRDKDYENAVKEFNSVLSYNPNDAKTHYNLGIIYDDYFKNKEKARYHYRAFLDLQPESDDAESVREWLAELER